MKPRKIMSSKDQGLTVGELTIAIAVLIIGGIIWSNLSKDKNYDQSLNIHLNTISAMQDNQINFLQS